MTQPVAISEAILPLGRLPLQPDGRPVELLPLNRRPLLDWALEEAVQARVSRILLVAGAAYGPAAALHDHARQVLKALPLRPNQPPPELMLLQPQPEETPAPEGWDALVRAAAARCDGANVLLIDPSMPLLRGRQVVTYTGFMLGRAAAALPPEQPLLAHAELPWERALALPVLVPRGKRLRFRFDRSLRGEAATVFAGRALLRLPLPAPENTALTGWTAAYRFPFETLVRLLLSQGACGYPLDFEPLEHPATLPAPLPVTPLSSPAALPAGLPLIMRSERAGLASLSEHFR